MNTVSDDNIDAIVARAKCASGRKEIMLSDDVMYLVEKVKAMQETINDLIQEIDDIYDYDRPRNLIGS